VTNTIAENLKRLRRERLLTQQDLARLSGVGFQSVARAEQGRVEPRFSTLRKLAAALDVDPLELVREHPGEDPEQG
jgi:transcriptional regulator with XRE-family HTH domain